MKKFFEEHGGVAIILIVIAVLLVLVGSVKGLDEGTGKVNGSGIASIVGNTYSNAIDKFKDSFNNVLSGTGDNNNSNPTFGPNGEPLVSTTESQVGKYADIDGDGTVDGIIFADLAVGGSGIWCEDDLKNDEFSTTYGTYTIPTVSSAKDYYVSQKSYTNKLGGTAEVLSPTGSGNDRFYIMTLGDINSERCDWYYAAQGKISDYASITSPDFGKGKSNTATMISKWNSEAYGNKNDCWQEHKDLWGEIQTQASNGWFVPSVREWAAFLDKLGITESNYESKGLSHWYWTSSLYDENNVFVIPTWAESMTDCYLHCDSEIYSEAWVRLATTF